MPLDQKAIDELKEIYRQEYGEELSDEEAWEMGNRLLRLFMILTTPRDPMDANDTDNTGQTT